ncbi:b859ea47-0f23-4981-8abd-891c8df04e8b [Thermothielavioides terrestris]|uniref:B859ea47-0f23-4981-8abd-891c8df04e8b n=1 Tax=Thermothielavioides terrestris TaxID=2587410 RepID=A0A446BVL8_9PEZI|nr:b859ea47-0f23-4981-8abd-891c8df04e8b [Thermothielavioides terrestris]
MSVATIALKEQ